MPDRTNKELDSPVRVVISPSQSSYFAGEPFSVTITFTNTRLPEAGPSKVNGHSGHKRGAHSISSAPLARPPTSPGTPRYTAQAPAYHSKPVDDVPRRKGLVGKQRPVTTLFQGSNDLPELLEQRRRKQLASKSYSMSVSPMELEEALARGAISPSAYMQQTFFHDSKHNPNSPLVSSPLARRDTFPANHPHSRKDSLRDGQLSLDILAPTTSTPPAPYSPHASSSSFSLALDPIAEGTHSPYPSTPAIGSPTLESITLPPQMSSQSVYAYPPPKSFTNGQAPRLHLGLGQPANPPRGYPQGVQRNPPFPTNNELVLYSYAQLSGKVRLSSIPGSPLSPDQSRTLEEMRSALLNRAVLGGGSMDITASLSGGPMSPTMRPRVMHGRTSSFGGSLLSMLNPSSLLGSGATPSTNSAVPMNSREGKRRSMSGHGSTFSISLPSASAKTGALAGPVELNDSPSDEPLPALEVQPAMLAVDLTLAPGESKSYTYKIKLPDVLPPTFKGKSLVFSYELIVGICRAASPSGGGAVGANSISQVMKVPIRVYNHVCVGRSLKPYDLLWPVSHRMDVGMPGMEARVIEINNAARRKIQSNARLTSPAPSEEDTLDSLQRYAKVLSQSTRTSNGNGVANDARLLQQGKESEREDEGVLTGCREAVEILTRNPKKASYDVSKDGVKVATLTFTKAAYRLGETIGGVVELNEQTSRARVIKLTAILESHETLPSSISPPAASRYLRRAHAEHHSSFTLNTLRTTFSLDIPSDASPAFQVRVGTPPLSSPRVTTPGGLEWKVRLCLLVSVASEGSYVGQQGTRFKTLLRDGSRGEWGSSWCAIGGNAPLERNMPVKVSVPVSPVVASARSWSSFLVSSLLYGSADPEKREREYQDGDVLDEDAVDELAEGYDGIIADPAGGVGTGVDYSGGEEEGMWREAKVDMVECEVPVKVYPGNTAYKALDVVFDI